MTVEYAEFNAPDLEWYWSLDETGDLRVYVKKPPNRFHRLMHWLILGIYWSREKK